MKKTQTFLVMLILCSPFFSLIKSHPIQAAEQTQYESPAGVGFYGSYEYPKDESSSSVEKSSSDERQDSSTAEQQISGDNQFESEPIKKSFPRTGETSSRYLGLIGIGILVSALLIIFIKKKNIWGKR